MPQLDREFHQHFTFDASSTSSIDSDVNLLVHSKFAHDAICTSPIDNGATYMAPLSPDLQEVNVADIMNLLNNTNPCNSSEESESDSSDIPSPTWDSSRIPLQTQMSNYSSDGECDSRERISCSYNPDSSNYEPHVSIRDGLSVNDIAAEYDSNLVSKYFEYSIKPEPKHTGHTFFVLEAPIDKMGWDGIFGYLTSHEAYCLCVGNHLGHNLHTRG